MIGKLSFSLYVGSNIEYLKGILKRNLLINILFTTRICRKYFKKL